MIFSTMLESSTTEIRGFISLQDNARMLIFQRLFLDNDSGEKMDVNVQSLILIKKTTKIMQIIFRFTHLTMNSEIKLLYNCTLIMLIKTFTNAPLCYPSRVRNTCRFLDSLPIPEQTLLSSQHFFI